MPSRIESFLTSQSPIQAASQGCPSGDAVIPANLSQAWDPPSPGDGVFALETPPHNTWQAHSSHESPMSMQYPPSSPFHIRPSLYQGICGAARPRDEEDETGDLVL